MEKYICPKHNICKYEGNCNHNIPHIWKDTCHRNYCFLKELSGTKCIKVEEKNTRNKYIRLEME